MAYYRDYLALDKILDAQTLESDKHGQHAHDEMLFIVTHQAFELWFKQVMYELRSVIDTLDVPYVPEAAVATCHARLQRVNKIMELATNQFSILETMTPPDFMDFRAFLNPASGFQSAQFRVLEIALGLPEQKRVLKHYSDAMDPRDKAIIEQARELTSLFTVVEKWLEKMPFMEASGFTFWQAYRQAVVDMLNRDRAEVRTLAEAEQRDPADALAQIDGIEDGFHGLFDEQRYTEMLTSGTRRLSQRATHAVLFIATYRNEPLLQIPYRFIDAVTELDKLISLWRFRHTLMVSRMIGMRVGTGGSSGHDYLMQTAIKQRVFDDVTAMNSFLIPAMYIPSLPQELAQRLQFVNEART